MKWIFSIILGALMLSTQAQSTLKGVLLDSENNKIGFAYIALYKSADSSMVKVETAGEFGDFSITNLNPGSYFLKATFVGLPDLVKNDITLSINETKELGDLTFEKQTEQLAEVNITAERAMVVIEPDKTIFNVEGTVNSTGSDAVELLRKAPAVTVDNNDNISVLGRSGVRLYVDGKQLPLAGDDLSNYLKNLPADQIDRIEIITNPGAKYDAEGNAGIIDIRLKKDKSIGANGTISGTYTQGILTRYNFNGSGNYRNKKLNAFGTVGYNKNDNFHNITFQSYQNGLFMDEINDTQNNRDIFNVRFGTDFFLNDKHTVGFLVTSRNVDAESIGFNKIAISDQQNISFIDSVLVAESLGLAQRKQNTVNANYQFNGEKSQSLNIDLDYGVYTNANERSQPNLYYNALEDSVLSGTENSFNTPTDISIYTTKIDYEQPVAKGKLGLGAKYSFVSTHNTFEVFDVLENSEAINNSRSNLFDYTENVYSGYVSYARPLGKKFNFSGGLRAEQTKANGDLTAFDTSLDEPPVNFSYLSWFPTAGLTWNVSKTQSLAFNYGRRINRPDYNVLNPFRNQLSQLSIEKGNPFLKPEFVNNIELGYTLMYMYNLKIGYSRTNNKITRLIGPDDSDPKASFISWDNLATQSVWSANASLPFRFTKWWDAYFNLSGSHINNQADYGDGAIVDVQAFSYTIYSQQTIKLPKEFKAQLSGYYSGPGVWGGVFVYEANWSIDAGLQREFLNKRLSAKISVNNIFNRIGWRGESSFNGLNSFGTGRWDARFVSLNMKYNFGNQNVKSRKRKTGIESEQKRVGK